METISETVEGDPTSRRRVIRRVYKVQYRPDNKQPTGPSSSSTRRKSGSQKNTSLQRGKSMKAFDQSTDTDIFALGSAFKDGQFSIDDFLDTSWPGTTGFRVQKVTCTTQKDGEAAETREYTSTGGLQPIGDLPPVEGMAPLGETKAQALLPYVKKQTIVTTTRPGTGEAIKTVSVQTSNDSGEETYDNLGTHLEPLLPRGGYTNQYGLQGNTTWGARDESGLSLGRMQPSAGDSVRTSISSNYDNAVQPADHGKQRRVSSEISGQNETERKPLLPAPEADLTVASADGDEAKDEENLPDTPTKKDVRIDMDGSDTHSSSSEGEEADFRPKQKTSATCPFYSPKKKARQIKGKRMARGVDPSRGKVGMTASEIHLQGQERKLPAVQQMVMNYNRMLDSFRDQFVETLFRAVKLNGVEVVKILCQLVLRKDMKLASEAMREPESSATVLHVALLYDHAEIVEYLIDIGDCDLMVATYTKDEYKNQTALHVAVANGNQHLVNKLLSSLQRKQRKVLMNTVATGSYFQKHHPDGQLCLTAAAWAGNFDMLITLARYGANMRLKNMDGNTVMHCIIESSASHPDKMDYEVMVEKTFEAVGEWSKQCHYKSQIEDQRVLEQRQKQISTFHALLNTRNNAGLTPLALAAESGTPLLQYILNMETIYKIPQTKLGSISWVTYDVTDVTSFASDTYNKFSVLHILAHNSGRLSQNANMEKDAEASFLDQEPIKTLVAMKWGVYRWVYICWCLLHLSVHIAFTYQTFDNNSYLYNTMEGSEDPRTSHPAGHPRGQPVNPWVGVFVVLPLVYIVLELVDIFAIYPYSFRYMENMSWPRKLTRRLQSEWVITGNGPYRWVMMAYSILTIAWFVLYMNCSASQNMVLSMTLLMGWIFVLFFTRGCRVTSRFSIMIQKMFFRDLMYFLAVYVIILIAFSFAMNAMYSHLHQSSIHLPKIFYRMMNIVTELDQKETLSQPNHPLFTKMLLIMYAIVAVILLMNMLIAMMNTSYETVRITRSNLWKQQQLSIMLMMERRLFWIRWLGRKSESHVWQKELEGEVKSYLDVTITYF